MFDSAAENPYAIVEDGACISSFVELGSGGVVGESIDVVRLVEVMVLNFSDEVEVKSACFLMMSCDCISATDGPHPIPEDGACMSSFF